MRLTLNGKPYVLEEPAATVAELVQRLGLKTEQVAVELNRELVPRAAHVARPLADGDVLEIVTLVGGG